MQSEHGTGLGDLSFTSPTTILNALYYSERVKPLAGLLTNASGLRVGKALDTAYVVIKVRFLFSTSLFGIEET